MDYTVALFSNGYLSTPHSTDWATATLSRELWEELYSRGANQGDRQFLRFEYDTRTIIVAVGRPSMDTNQLCSEQYHVYIDRMFLEQLGLYGDGEPIRTTVFSQDAFPEATRIVIRSVDSAIYNSNVKEELEHALTQLGVLQVHTQLQVPIQALGSYPIDLFISQLEPADMVVCHGDEVVIEFEEPVDAIEAPPQRPPTPIPIQSLPFMIPLLSEEEQSSQSVQPEIDQSGRILGSDPTVQPPSWRQQLGPPRRR